MKVVSLGNIVFDVLGYRESFPIEDARNNYDDLVTGFGGPAANAAYVLNLYGDDVDFYGIIGDDYHGNEIIDELEKYDINTNYITRKEGFITPYSFIIIAEDKKTRTINTYRDPKEKEAEQDITFADKQYDVIYTDGKYPTKFFELKEKNEGAITIIDAGRCNDNVISVCKEIDYLICSLDFATEYMKRIETNIEINHENMGEILKYLKEDFEKSKIIITAGKSGCYYYDENNAVKNYRVNIDPDKVVDTNAAGDIFHGAFTHALINGIEYEDCIKFASHVATNSTREKGGKVSCPVLSETTYEEKQKTLKKIRVPQKKF